MRNVTWDDLDGDNAFTVLGTIGGLLKRLDRATGGAHAAAYQAEATAGDYEHLLAVSHRYALAHLAVTLAVPQERT
ncbi:MAG: hypothetical protein WCB04_02650 [Mycobacteriales bacterium]